jgi:hypothetical protein
LRIGHRPREPDAYFERQVRHAIKVNASVVARRKDKETLMLIILDDGGAWGSGRKLSKAIALEDPSLLDNVRGRLHRAPNHPNVQQQRIERRLRFRKKRAVLGTRGSGGDDQVRACAERSKYHKDDNERDQAQ